MQEDPIGFFDSGVGGISVLKRAVEIMPEENYIYFGDSLNAPYGTKTKEQVFELTESAIKRLVKKNVKAIVVACNTASAYALEKIEKKSKIPMIGVVKPGAKTAAEVTVNGKIGVIATEGTIRSEIYKRYIEELKAEAEVIGKACPLFVPLVEEGLLEDPVTDEIAQRYLSVLIDSGIDTLILGCTHYPLIRSTVGRVMGEQVRLVNPAYETALELKNLLQEKELLQDEKPMLGTNQYQFFVSDGADKFRYFANTIFKYGVLAVKQINIEEY